MNYRTLTTALVLLVVLASCGYLAERRFETLYGPQQAIDRITYDADLQLQASRAQQILENRCTVCHACYDAPCQLRLDALEGLQRGAHKEKVYDGTRLFASTPTRLFYDAQHTAQWREKQFFAVLNERAQSAEANIKNSVVAQMLLLKQRHPLPKQRLLSDTFTLSLDRQQQCPSIEEFEQFADNHPLWGMPYGLPGLPEEESALLLKWIENGALHAPEQALPPMLQQQVAHWEAFLNGASLKQQLMSRYLYEHLFLNHLYFSNAEPPVFFQLVRSRTASGEKIAPIATRFPYDDPGVNPFYYRLRRVTSSIVSKTHVPYALNQARMQRWRALFLQAPYEVTQLPGYQADVAANPFKSFEAIPTDSRYRFLLDDAQLFINNFIKGPVCRGQVAVDVINDHFWVFFVDPDSLVIEKNAGFLAEQSEHLRLPIEENSDGLNLLSWFKYAQLHQNYLQAKQDYLDRIMPHQGGVTLDLVWQGDGHNDNAALTVFRHGDNASVVKGMVGKAPKTALVLGYSLFERIHYLLVAGFDVYGNIRHQLYARLYMDFLRMDGEFNFLTALPEPSRKVERDFWYRGARTEVTDYINWRHQNSNVHTNIHYSSDQPKLELYGLIKQRLRQVLNKRYELEPILQFDYVKQLNRVNAIRGPAASLMPELSFITISDADPGARTFTLIRNSAHSNIAHLFSEDTERLPEEDTLTLVRGIIGAYPNAFFRMQRHQVAQWLAALSALRDEADYRALLDDYGVRRSDAHFWRHSDTLHADYRALDPIEAGMLDYNRLQNR